MEAVISTKDSDSSRKERHDDWTSSAFSAVRRVAGFKPVY